MSLEDDFKKLEKFEKDIGVFFKDKELLRRAFTHRSFVNEHREEALENNERLEFLGDAVLELITSVYLFHEYPDVMEGELTAYRSGLVNTVSLAETAEELDINDYLLLSKGEAQDLGRARQYILADTMEAVIGAIYLDQGYEAANKFLSEKLLPKTKKIVNKNLWQDAKSLFQEKAQEIESITPTYEVLEETGPDHDKTFTTGVYLNDELIAKADGPSKQDAEQNAAEEALEKKSWR